RARLRSPRPRHRHGPREPRRAPAHGARRRRPRQGAPAALVRAGRAEGRRGPRPLLRRPARLRRGVRHLRARLPRAARPPARGARGLIDGALGAALAERLGSAVASSRPIGGGDINDAYEVAFADGRRLFVKTNARAPRAMFPAEAGGLAWLAEARALR